MERMDVIEKVPDDEACEWVNSLACSRKASGELRICMDPKNLNKAIKRTHHKTPTLEEISHKMSGATVFSKMDLKHGYWTIELDEASSKLCTFNSPAGKYRYKRLPFGLTVSGDIFQKLMDDVMRDTGDGVIGIADDLVVFGKDVESHDAAMHKLVEVSERHGVVFRHDKCHIRCPSIKFYGMVWSKDGMQPDGVKCDDIREKSPPGNKQELQFPQVDSLPGCPCAPPVW